MDIPLPLNSLEGLPSYQSPDGNIRHLTISLAHICAEVPHHIVNTFPQLHGDLHLYLIDTIVGHAVIHMATDNAWPGILSATDLSGYIITPDESTLLVSLALLCSERIDRVMRQKLNARCDFAWVEHSHYPFYVIGYQ